MWSSVTSESSAPCSRSKHSATLLGGHLYLLGGKNGNIPLKDFWRYSLVEGRWEQLKTSGETPPCLQEHSAVAYKDSLYVFGGEVGFSAGTETPLWVYHVKGNSWRKVRTQKGVVVPRGRRGHTALVYQGAMLVYGGYQDLRGSSSDLWVFDFETESWHLLSGRGEQPPARHKHSAVLHDGAMWVYGGMTDLNDRADLWRWDTGSKVWTNIKCKQGPGPLHSHAACKLPSSMLLFGGERDGQPSGELWRFHFGTETWERLQPSGMRPQARAESVALAVSELLLAPSSAPVGCSPASPGFSTPYSGSTTPGVGPHRYRHSSVDRANSCRPFHSKVSPCERKYVFKHHDLTPSRGYTCAVEDNRQNIFLREITKLSNMNLTAKLSRNNCSYSVLSNDSGDSCTSSNPPSDHDTPNKMVKSASVNVISRRMNQQKPRPISTQGRLEPSCLLPRDPVSVPNFSTIQTALTPVEAARLVFVDSDEDSDEKAKPTDFSTLHQIFQPKTPTTERGECEGAESPKNNEDVKSLRHGYHGNGAKTPQEFIPKSASVVRFKEHLVELEEASEETVSTSDYASIETMNCISHIRISPDSKHGLSEDSNKHCFNEEDEDKNSWDNNSKFPPARPHLQLSKKQLKNKTEGPYGFSNPNYLGPDIQTILAGIQNGGQTANNKQHNSYAKLLNSPPDSVLEDATGRFLSQDELELHAMTPESCSGTLPFPSGRRRANVPRSLALTSPIEPSRSSLRKKSRASSASRVEALQARRQQLERREHSFYESELDVPLYMFLIGGKEQQVTVFKKPISIWKLELNSDIF